MSPQKLKQVVSKITGYHFSYGFAKRRAMAGMAIVAFIVINVIAAILIFGLPPFLPGILGPLLSPVTTGLFGPYIGPGAAAAILQALVTFPLLVIFIRRGWLGADEIG